MSILKNQKLMNKLCVPEAISENYYKPAMVSPPALNEFTDSELVSEAGGALVCDLEIYPNYFLIAFKSCLTGKTLFFEISPDSVLDKPKLRWVMSNFLIITFNGIKFDIPLLYLALETDVTALDLQIACNLIITENLRPREIEKYYKFKIKKINHIDIIEVAPLSASLKIYAGRSHTQKMQDLPFEPNKHLTKEEAYSVKCYCVNDLDCTMNLWLELEDNHECFSLREEMGRRYKVDLRSKSDAQIAEYAIASELKKITGFYPKTPETDYNKIINYWVPEFVCFQTETLNQALNDFKSFNFSINGSGSPMMPKEYRPKDSGGEGKKYKVKIGNSTYTMGMGGLHSNEESVSHYSDDETFLVDIDVASYYPMIILVLGLFPEHLGPEFLNVYSEIVYSRLGDKKAGRKAQANSKKIIINGSFGKFGNMWSKLYSPDLMLQVTITGQLCLLMLIELLELEGIPVVSGNTDGIVVKANKSREKDLKRLVTMWEKQTKFTMEYTYYTSIYSRDVNNYIAIPVDSSPKAKGVYSEKGSALGSRLSKNPETLILADAVIAFLHEGVSIEDTIMSCNDITRFVSVRTVKGGAVKDNHYLGKAVRWYYKKEEYGTINYAESNNKVPKTKGAWPLMDLPSTFPDDIDYEWYIREAYCILDDIGYYKTDELF